MRGRSNPHANSVRRKPARSRPREFSGPAAGFASYVAALKTGLPEVRNNAGGHGAAPDVPPVTEYIAAYAIHLTAANIVLCVEAYKARR